MLVKTKVLIAEENQDFLDKMCSLLAENVALRWFLRRKMAFSWWTASRQNARELY